jgi:hypothetical protein
MNSRLNVGVLKAIILLLGCTPIQVYGSQPWCGFVYGGTCPNCVTQTPGGCSCVPLNGACRCNPAGYKVTCEMNDFICEIHVPGCWLSSGSTALCATLELCSTPSGEDCGEYFEGLCEMPLPPNHPCQWREYTTVEASTYGQSAQPNCPH